MNTKFDDCIKKTLVLFLGGFFCFSPLTLSLTAQDWRASAGYAFKSYSASFTKNPSYSGKLSPIRKGIVEVELERYLFFGVYLAAQGEFVVQNDADSFYDGPVYFNQTNFSGVLGYQWPKWGVYAGLEGGRFWDIRFRGLGPNDETLWIKPENTSSAWSTSVKAGVKYYLMSFLRLQAGISRSLNLPKNLTPQQTTQGTSQLNSFDFNPYTVNVGISLSIPWNSKKYNRSSNTTANLPEIRKVRRVKFSSPLADGVAITSRFGSRWGRNHQGVDLDAGRGDPVQAAADGVVVVATRGTGYGKMIKISHGAGFSTVYAHLSKVKVKKGERVKRGDLIGKAGSSGVSTGPHLHFEIIKDGVHQNPQAFIVF